MCFYKEYEYPCSHRNHLLFIGLCGGSYTPCSSIFRVGDPGDVAKPLCAVCILTPLHPWSIIWGKFGDTWVNMSYGEPAFQGALMDIELPKSDLELELEIVVTRFQTGDYDDEDEIKFASGNDNIVYEDYFGPRQEQHDESLYQSLPAYNPQNSVHDMAYTLFYDLPPQMQSPAANTPAILAAPPRQQTPSTATHLQLPNIQNQNPNSQIILNNTAFRGMPSPPPSPPHRASVAMAPPPRRDRPTSSSVFDSRSASQQRAPEVHHQVPGVHHQVSRAPPTQGAINTYPGISMPHLATPVTNGPTNRPANGIVMYRQPIIQVRDNQPVPAPPHPFPPQPYPENLRLGDLVRLGLLGDVQYWAWRGNMQRRREEELAQETLRKNLDRKRAERAERRRKAEGW